MGDYNSTDEPFPAKPVKEDTFAVSTIIMLTVMLILIVAIVVLAILNEKRREIHDKKMKKLSELVNEESECSAVPKQDDAGVKSQQKKTATKSILTENSLDKSAAEGVDMSKSSQKIVSKSI